MKKVLDQTVREFKREVSKVMKVPEIEQKVLDATSNEPWGPHGSAMADIAQATRNYTDYQIIMAVIWKRINDTGRNWRHVYKALTLLEFLVAHGSERVIDDLKEHAYQLSTLVDFQYIDSRGKDQGQNVRRKSQNLVSLLNDKERIREVRQKAVENRDKYRGVSSTGGMYKPSSYHSTGGSYGGDRYEEDSYGSNSRYGGRDDDRYGRDRDGDRYRDDDRYGRDWERSGRDSDRSSRGGDRYKDDYNRHYDHEDDRYSSRRGDDRQSENYRAFEKDRDRAYDDDDRFPSRNGGGKGDDYGHDERRPERKFSDARPAAPPSYEEALGSPEYRASEERKDGGGLAAAVARASSRSNLSEVDSAPKAPSASSQVDDFDEFDPRASSVTAAAAAGAPSAHADLTFGQAESVGALLALPPPLFSLSSAQSSSSSDLFGDSGTSGFAPAPASANSNLVQQYDGGIFGDSPFKAETGLSTATSVPTNLLPTFSAPAPANPEPPSYMVSASTVPPPSFTASAPTNPQSSFSAPAPAQPPPVFSAYPSGEAGVSAVGMGTNNFNPYAAAPPLIPSQGPPVSFGRDALFGSDPLTATFGAPSNSAPPPAASSFTPAMAPQQAASSAFQVNLAPAAPSATLHPTYSGGLATLQPTFSGGSATLQHAYSAGSSTLQPTLSGGLATLQPTYSGTLQPTYSGGSSTLQPTYSGGSASLQPTYSGGSQAPKGSANPKLQPEKKFETKSTVWSDTLNKGLIDLNIAGPKSNPLADIGIDFDLLRTERIKEERTASKSTSTVNMGKAMGSGTGLGLAGAGAILPPVAPVMMNTMGMGMMPSMGMGMRPGMGPAMGMGGPMMPMGMNQGMPMRPNMGMGPGMGMGMGMGMPTYPNQQQYSGYR